MTFLVALLALAPGVYAWWTGRALLARVDDPAFPELVLARAQRRIQIAIAAAVLYAFVPGTHWVWANPLFVVALLAGSFPFRRTLYGETWTIADYIGYSVAGFVGMAGCWGALAFAPSLVFALVDGWTSATPVQGALAIGAVLAVALILWEHTYPLVWLRLHRASPLLRADLLPRFDEIVRRSSVSQRAPLVYRYGARGAYVMNAVALPSVGQPRVAFGDSLLELLTPDEIVAVFAHEVSHLEHYDRRRMLRFRVLAYLLVLGGTALPVVTLATAPAQAWAVKLLWPLLILAILALRVSKSQAHETESDLRAGALTGDPEAMVRALTKLHHYSRMPRRWPYDFERASSHPSLARRIQALRTQGPAAAAAAPAARLDAPLVLRSTEPGTYAALDDSRAYWFEGGPADPSSMSELREQATSYRAVAYADLTELRVAVLRGGGRLLLARDKNGKTWSMPLRADDVAPAQRALDVLDVRLGNHVREDWATKARLAATLLALALVSALDFSWPWIPLIITLAKPTTASVAAMGAMAIARVIVGALAGAFGASATGDWSAAWLAIFAIFAAGVWSCWIAWRRARGDERPAQRPFIVVVLACLVTLVIGTLAFGRMYGLSGITPPSLPAPAPGGGIALVLLGAGAALVTFRDTLRRRSGVAIAAAGLLVGLAAPGAERFTAGRTDTPRIAWTTGEAEVDGKLTVGGSAYRLHLSPNGERVAVQGTERQAVRYDETGADEVGLFLTRFTVGGRTGARRTIAANDLAFLDDERLVVLRPARSSEDSLELTVERAEAADSVKLWRLVIPAYAAPTLSVDRGSGAWRVMGSDVQVGATMTIAGKVGSDSITATRWGSLGNERPLHTYRDGTSLIATMHESFGKRHMLLAIFGFYRYNWDLWRVVNGERQSLGALPGMPDCGLTAEGEETLLCAANGGSGVSLWRLARRDARPMPIGALPANLELWDIGAGGQIAAGARDGATLALIDAASGRGRRLSVGGGVRQQSADSGPNTYPGYTMDVASAPGVIATLVMRGGKSEVTFYRVR